MQFSVGDLARHIPLIELKFYLPIIKGESPSYAGCDSSLAPDTKTILELYKEAENEMTKVFTNEPDAVLNERIKIPNGDISLRKWLRLIVEHEIHHRGQIYQLLSAQGVDVPNIFGLSSEDLIDISNS
ncbi:MAG: DinB family protein [Bacteroidota bacterium]